MVLFISGLGSLIVELNMAVSVETVIGCAAAVVVLNLSVVSIVSIGVTAFTTLVTPDGSMDLTAAAFSAENSSRMVFGCTTMEVVSLFTSMVSIVLIP